MKFSPASNHEEINDEDNGAIAFYIFKDNKDNIETYHIRASATPLSCIPWVPGPAVSDYWPITKEQIAVVLANDKEKIIDTNDYLKDSISLEDLESCFGFDHNKKTTLFEQEYKIQQKYLKDFYENKVNITRSQQNNFSGNSINVIDENDLAQIHRFSNKALSYLTSKDRFEKIIESNLKLSDLIRFDDDDLAYVTDPKCIEAIKKERVSLTDLSYMTKSELKKAIQQDNYTDQPTPKLIEALKKHLKLAIVPPKLVRFAKRSTFKDIDEMVLEGLKLRAVSGNWDDLKLDDLRSKGIKKYHTSPNDTMRIKAQLHALKENYNQHSKEKNPIWTSLGFKTAKNQNFQTKINATLAAVGHSNDTAPINFNVLDILEPELNSQPNPELLTTEQMQGIINNLKQTMSSLKKNDWTFFGFRTVTSYADQELKKIITSIETRQNQPKNQEIIPSSSSSLKK